jgi:hypothetical protein
MYGAISSTYLRPNSSCHAVVGHQAYVLRFVIVRYGHVSTPWDEVHHLRVTEEGRGRGDRVEKEREEG